MATEDKDQDKTEVIKAPEPEDSASPPAREEAEPDPVAGSTPPPGDAGEEAASAVDDSDSPPGSDPPSGAALAVPSEFTWETLEAAERAYQQSLVACWPHFAPVRAVRRGESLEFDDPMPGDWQPLTAQTQEWLLDRWHDAAYEGVASTFVTVLYAPPEPRQLAMVGGEFYPEDGERENQTEQFTAAVPVITSVPSRRWARPLRRGGDD